MRMIKFSVIEDLLPGYLSGELPENDLAIIEEWRRESTENEELFLNLLKAWDSLPLLNEMENYNSFEALKKVRKRINGKKQITWIKALQRIAAILIIPIILYSGFITYRAINTINEADKQPIMQTVTSRQGMITQFQLSDGTKVWLNADSELKFPTQFNGKLRDVSLKGEAFFEVVNNEKHPFRVKTKDLFIDVLGTSFNVNSFDDSKLTEVTLSEGKVSLSIEKEKGEKFLGFMKPGQRAVFDQESKLIYSQMVDVDKYISWRQSKLIFRDDNMEEVVKRLSRWFNVEIVIRDSEINKYVYKATFTNESIRQVLALLKISAPIDYEIQERKLLPSGEYSRQKVILKKKNL
jgi:ferric-dicitrate binding protein FerR (iron transport regulator)